MKNNHSVASELWVPAFGWEGFYEVSNLGNVRSVQRKGKTSFGERSYGGKVLNPIKHNSGYLVVNLTVSKGKRKQVLIHRLILESFLGPAPAGSECCHSNGNRNDPRLENLRWDTRKNNHADKRVHGTWQGGENNPYHKLTAPQVIAIRESSDSKEELSSRFNVSVSCIEKVKYRATWKHIGGSND